MRNYWMRIALGAVAIFAVGMVGLTLVHRGVSGVRGVVQGTGPITLPVAFVPFKLDGEKLGTIHRIKVYRSAPDQVKSVNLLVRLADSVNPSRLADCILVAEGFEKFNSQTTIRCAAAADTTGDSLAHIGQIRLTRGNMAFQLFMPRDAIKELTDSDSMFVGEDSTDAIERRVDSMAQAAENRADSISEAVNRRVSRQMADSSRRR